MIRGKLPYQMEVLYDEPSHSVRVFGRLLALPGSTKQLQDLSECNKCGWSEK